MSVLDYTYGSPAFTLISRSLHGTHLCYHPAADAACLTAGQMAVVAIGQVNADFLSDKHLETVHGLTSLGDIQLVVVSIAHYDFSPSFRNPGLTRDERCMNGCLRQGWKAKPFCLNVKNNKNNTLCADAQRVHGGIWETDGYSISIKAARRVSICPLSEVE